MSEERDSQFEEWMLKRFGSSARWKGTVLGEDLYECWQAARQSAGATGRVDDQTTVALMLKATGEDYYESDAWKLRLFVEYMDAARDIASDGDNGAKDQIERYQKICAAAYQLAGLVDAPLRFLDALSDAANGEPMEDGINLLPVTLDECGYVQPAESKRMELTDDELFALIKQVDPRAVRIPPGIRAIADALLARAQAKGA